MLTWKLWHALRHPAYGNPVFEFAIITHNAPERTKARQTRSGIFFTLYLMAAFGLTWFTKIWSIALFMIFFAPLLVLALLLPVRGSGLAMQVASIISEEQRRRRYDLLCLLPGGELHSNWLLCTAYLYREYRTRRYAAKLDYISRRSWLRRWGFLVAVGIVGALFGLMDEPVFVFLYAFFVISWVVIDVLYVDRAQTTILGCMVGMLAPVYLPGQLDTRMVALAVQATMQLMTYALVAILAILVLPFGYIRLGIGWEWALVTEPVILLAALVGLRELLIRQGWRLLMRRLNASPDILDTLAYAGRTR